jgi:putative ABC transport system permease protein
MGVIFRLALRNIKEHKAKSIIIALFIILGTTIVELGNGFLESVNRGLERDFRAHYTGDIVISAPAPEGARMDMFGVSNMASLGEMEQIPAIPDIAAVDQQIAAVKGIRAGTKLISAKAILMKGTEAEFDNDNDDTTNLPMCFLFAGEYDTYFKMFPGQHISEGTYPDKNENTLLIDIRLRDKYQKYYQKTLNVGDVIVLSGYGTKGIAREARVCGFYTQPEEHSAMYPLVYCNPSFAREFAYLTYGATFAQELPSSVDTSLASDSEDDLFGGSDTMVQTDADVLADKKQNYNKILGNTSLRDKLNKTDDGAWNFIILKTDNSHDADKITRTLKTAFTKNKISANVMNWKAASATFTSSVDGITGIFTALVIILTIVVFIIIMNTMTVSVIERTSEIGTMRALGAEKNFIRKLFFSESLLIGLLSSGAGSLLALICMAFINSLHLAVNGDMVKMILGGGLIAFIPTVKNILGTILLITTGSILANVYPVSSALKITPLKALSKDGE